MGTPAGEKTADSVMETSTDETIPVPSFQLFTKAERIRQLNDIDKSITQLLQSAGLAVKTLTVCQKNTNSATQSAAQSADHLPQSFTDATNIYLKGLHSVDVRLKRQIHGLKQAGIITGAKEPPSRLDGQNLESSRVARDNNPLDVGWLNSRSGKVGRDMEAELWAKTRAFLEALEAEKNNSGGPREVEGQEMDD